MSALIVVSHDHARFIQYCARAAARPSYRSAAQPLARSTVSEPYQAHLAPSRATGSVKVMVVPKPTRDWALICPPWASTRRLDMASPSPVLPGWAPGTDRKRWKRRVRYSGGMPCPVSATEIDM